jgi:ubiquinone/menaquinone biosynthesis C-methylase UbiE
VPPRGPSRAFFDVWSRTYDNPVLQALMYRPVQEAVMVALREQRPRRVLDVGCGTGLFTTRLRAELGADVVGCDYSWGMISQARRRSQAPSWMVANAMALPVPATAVDAIVCTESFHWYPDQRLALDEFSRALRPAGRLYVALVNPRLESMSDWTQLVSRRYGQPLHWPTSEQMRSMATTAGLRVVRQQRLLRLPSVVLFPVVLTIAERPASEQVGQATPASRPGRP